MRSAYVLTMGAFLFIVPMLGFLAETNQPLGQWGEVIGNNVSSFTTMAAFWTRTVFDPILPGEH